MKTDQNINKINHSDDSCTKRNLVLEIQDILKELEISIYQITVTKKEAVELYFIKKSLDMRRKNNVTEIKIIVFRDFELDGKKMRGSSSATIYPMMNHDEIKSTLKDTYYAASFVKNPYYEIPTGQYEECVTIPSSLCNHTLEENAKLLANALYEEDTESDTFINSAEFFSKCKMVRMINSNGIDVSYEKYSITGEFIAQSIKPTDVEIYKQFSYNTLALDEIKKLSKDTLAITKSRAGAFTAPKTGTYNIILSDEYVETLLSYYSIRSKSKYIYPGLSNYKVGANVQGASVKGELLNIDLMPSVPFSDEGIPMIERSLITNGVLDTIQGESVYAYYLGIKPIGNYDCIKVNNGTITTSEMKQTPYLDIVYFSDFQTDPLTGDFGSEIRLAFYYDGNTVTPVTGGSISGNITNFHNQFIFSKERQSRATFDGPKAILLKDVLVSGC